MPLFGVFGEMEKLLEDGLFPVQGCFREVLLRALKIDYLTLNFKRLLEAVACSGVFSEQILGWEGGENGEE